MNLSRAVSEIDGDSVKNRKIFPSTPCIFAPPLKGSPWNWVPALGLKKNYNDGANGPNKKFDDIFSRVDRMHQRDGGTDGHRATAKTALTHSIAR